MTHQPIDHDAEVPSRSVPPPGQAASPATPSPPTPASASDRYTPSTRNLVLAIVALLWGLGILVNWAVGSQPAANEAYATGQLLAAVFGLVLAGAGGWQLRREIGARTRVR